MANPILQLDSFITYTDSNGNKQRIGVPAKQFSTLVSVYRIDLDFPISSGLLDVWDPTTWPGWLVGAPFKALFLVASVDLKGGLTQSKAAAPVFVPLNLVANVPLFLGDGTTFKAATDEIGTGGVACNFDRVRYSNPAAAAAAGKLLGYVGF